MSKRKYNKILVSRFNELEKFQYSILEWHYRTINRQSEDFPQIQYFDKLRYMSYRPCITNYGGLGESELLRILSKR